VSALRRGGRERRHRDGADARRSRRSRPSRLPRSGSGRRRAADRGSAIVHTRFRRRPSAS